MNLHNKSMCAALRTALGAIFTLDDRGVDVTRISVDGGMPVVDLACAPPFPLPREPVVSHVREGIQPPKRLCRVEVGGVTLRWYETEARRSQ